MVSKNLFLNGTMTVAMCLPFVAYLIFWKAGFVHFGYGSPALCCSFCHGFGF